VGVDLSATWPYRDFTIEICGGRYRVFLGIGCPRAGVSPRSDTPGVYDGMDFLRAFNEGALLPRPASS
jgi:hypothetical protein